MAFKVDSAKFQAEGALLQWMTVARRMGLAEALGGRQLPSVLQLRWTLHPELGFPTEPFIIWRRRRAARGPKPIAAEISSFPVFGGQLVDLKGAYSVVILNVSGSGGIVSAFAGAPQVSSVTAAASIPAGANVDVTLTAPWIEVLAVSNAVTINSVRGVRADDLSAAEGWEKLERVGLPVAKADWAGQGIGRHGEDQGMFGAFTDAASAAGQRLERGAPPIGWGPQIAAGVPAPPWSAPGTSSLITSLNQSILNDLRGIASLPPALQAATQIGKTLPPPENSSGQRMSRPGSTAQVSPLSMTYMAAATDCFDCLALGFGTAYLVVRQAGSDFTALDYDYMVTARWEKGPQGNGDPVDYAALVPSPGPAVAPPIPANMAQATMGNLRPAAANGDWRGSVRVTWDRPVPIPLFRPRSFAFARAGVAPPSPAALLMNRRDDGTPLPIAVNYYTSPVDPEPNRLNAVEREIPIPNDPGKRTSKYAAAHQDIYGQWSNWVAIDAPIEQPPVDDVRIVSAELRFASVPSPPATKCPASLVLEFLWDWRVRSPRTISFRGRMHPAAYHGAPPPDTTLPGGLQTRLGGPLTTTFTLNFDLLAANGAPTSSWPGFDPLAHCLALDQAGEQQVPFGAAQGDSRRYRVTVPGFELDFASTGHIGLALWAQGQEAIPPQHTGSWSREPSVISTSDPRPPLIIPDIVTLASLPDAAGEAHAVLKWSASPGADGYFIYETTETKLLRAVGEPEADASKTLSQRLTRLLQIFDADPAGRRSAFTRRNDRSIKATSQDVTLPRGSTSIHLYVVLGLSAGQVEAAWPGSSTALYAFAAPRIPKPAAPMIEAASILDTTVVPPVYRTRIRLETRKGPRVRRIDLHRVRVDDAAKELDTMGPPVLQLDALTAGWQVTETTDARGAHIAAAQGRDTPGGSWKRVWYRAVAWSADDPLRGVLAARSPASTAAWVVIPPPTPPDLSAITTDWPGTQPQDVLLKWTSAAPLEKSPLGYHTLAIRARRLGAPDGEAPIVAFDGPLSELPAAQPATGSGAWRIAGGKPAEYRALIRRAALGDAVEVSVRITDPLGRTSEALLTIQPGSILPDPVLTGFVLTASVLPPGAMLRWSSDTPLDHGPYTLRVRVTRPIRFLGGHPIPQPPITLELLLKDVPLDEPGPVPPGADPLRVRREPGPGPSFQYYAFVRVPFTQIVVQLISPDGRTAQHVQTPS